MLLLSLVLVFTAANAFFFLLVWEVMALSAYCLVSYEHDSKETRRAGTVFLIMSHAGAGLLLMAFLVLGAMTGGLRFSEFHHVLSRVAPQMQALLLALFLLGFGVKAGIAPLHVWLPAAHPVAPTNISALTSGTVIKAGVYCRARVLLDFLDVPPLWSGILILTAGVMSGLVGVLYALMEHDLKRLLAYHSIENIGIILTGFGAGLMFRSLGQPRLAALALIAGLYHTLNHAIFKSLFFRRRSGAPGSRHPKHGTHGRPDPALAGHSLLLFDGGHCHLWLTYQALLAGFGTTQSLTRLMFPIAGSLLALTAALASACFVKAFGITFLALPRSPQAAEAQEAPWTRRAGMAALALTCVGLGLGAAWFFPVFDPITHSAFGVRISSAVVGAEGTVLSAILPGGGTVSTPGLAAMLVLLSGAPALLWLY